MQALPSSVNTSLLRFHVLKYTRDIDTSQIPAPVCMVHDVNELVPTFDRALFVQQGMLSQDNSKLSDAEVLQFVAHIKLLQKIKTTIDVEGVFHHCIMEDKVDLLPNFMTKNLAVINNVPRNYDVAHFYVFPQQSWIFNLGHVYETLPQLKGACAYTVSPKGLNTVLSKVVPMSKPYDVMLRNKGLVSYTIYSDMVQHLNPEADIGDYDDFM